MSFAEGASLRQLLAFLDAHRQCAYGILFLGAYFETVVPFSLIVPGELFFLGGALLAGMGALDLWAVLAVLYSGGILGDNSSYWMGRHYGGELLGRVARLPMIGRLARPENHARAIAFFRRRGALAVFTARLSGPASWVTPALAGIFRLDYPTFLRCNTPAVIIGISEFVLAGYFFGRHLETLRRGLDDVARIGLTVAAAIAVGLIARRCLNRGALQRSA